MLALLLRALRSPLTLFLLFGCALFAADRLLNGATIDNSAGDREIRITRSQQLALREAFQAEHGRQPSNAELRASLSFWIDEQVLYREAMALNLDRADVVVRRQLAQKMRFLLEQGTALTAPSDADLQAWLTQHASQYGAPPSVNFEHVFLSRGGHGNDLLSDAERIRQQLKRDPDAWQALSDPFASGLILKQVTPAMLRAEFGPTFAPAIKHFPEGQWSGPIASSFGLHLVRITARAAFQPASLHTVRAQVLTDYEIAERKRLSQEALARLKASYRVRFDDAPS
ncbi:MAG: peptidylprolyl isomerase [Pseudomonadota bacterium]